MQPDRHTRHARVAQSRPIKIAGSGSKKACRAARRNRIVVSEWRVSLALHRIGTSNENHSTARIVTRADELRHNFSFSHSYYVLDVRYACYQAL